MIDFITFQWYYISWYSYNNNESNNNDDDDDECVEKVTG